MLVYDIIDVVPDPNNPQTNHKFKTFHSSDEKNPVVALCAVNGHLLGTIGTKVLAYAMEDGALNGIAFLDVSIFVVSLSSVKNFILIGDIYKSVWFVAFQEDPPKMVLLGKDLYPVSVVSSEFIVSDTSLLMLVSDVHHNLQLMSYEPLASQSQIGQRLLRRAEMNLGYEIESFCRIRLCPKILDGEIIPSMKMGVIAGTLDGGLCSVLPITEKIFKRLYGVYARMVTHMEHHAGLNPRGYRQIVLPYKSIYSQAVVTGPPGPRGILDGALLHKFIKLSVHHQREVSKSIGLNENRILDDLLELRSSLDYF
jgi:cleavage and polyadenylation specificity factor subunit 1